MPGSPATPEHPMGRRIAYFVIGVVMGLAAGFFNGLLVANMQLVQGAFGMTAVEANWLNVAYSISNVCASLLLIKFRQRFGVGALARLTLPAFALICFAQLFLHSYSLELLLRAVSGAVGSALTSFCMFYIMQSLPAKSRLGGMVLGIGITQLALPLARVLSPLLLASGNIQHLFLFELGMALLAIGCAALLPLPPADTVKAFEPLDGLTFLLMAPGIALLCAVLAQGRTVWWTTPWLGYALAGAVLLIGAAHIVEHNRANPLLNIRWMASGEIVGFALLAASMRILLSEQNFGSAGLLLLLGMGTDQLVTLYLIVSAATLAALVASLLTLNPQDLLRPIIISCGLIALGAWMDSTASNLTRPAQLYASQTMIAFAAMYFVGPLMMSGMLRAYAKGASHIVTFTAMFNIAQTVGGLAGTAALGTLQVVRERFHSNELVQNILATDPQVAARLDALSATYGRVLADPVLRRAEGAALLGQQVTREANILAYNDVFQAIAVLATFVFVGLGMRWVYNRIHGINPLAEDLATLARMRSSNTNG
nr:MFS transporter [Ramlibacter agri]